LKIRVHKKPHSGIFGSLLTSSQTGKTIIHSTIVKTYMTTILSCKYQFIFHRIQKFNTNGKCYKSIFTCYKFLVSKSLYKVSYDISHRNPIHNQRQTHQALQSQPYLP